MFSSNFNHLRNGRELKSNTHCSTFQYNGRSADDRDDAERYSNRTVLSCDGYVHPFKWGIGEMGHLLIPFLKIKEWHFFLLFFFFQEYIFIWVKPRIDIRINACDFNEMSAYSTVICILFASLIYFVSSNVRMCIVFYSNGITILGFGLNQNLDFIAFALVFYSFKNFKSYFSHTYVYF